MAVMFAKDLQVLNRPYICISTDEACALDCYCNNKEEAGNCDDDINNQLTQGRALPQL